MPVSLAVVVLVAATPVLGLVVLTAAGQRRRHRSLGRGVVAGIFFPITWVVWYAVDVSKQQSNDD